MTKIKKLVGIILSVFVIATITVIIVTAANMNNAEIIAELSGDSIESIVNERSETGKTYGAIVNESGYLAQFKEKSLEMKKEILNERVAEGSITQERANEIIDSIESNLENCDGSGVREHAQNKGSGFGGFNGNGKANGQGNGLGSNRK